MGNGPHRRRRAHDSGHGFLLTATANKLKFEGIGSGTPTMQGFSNAHPIVRFWLIADIHPHSELRPLYPRKRTSRWVPLYVCLLPKADISSRPSLHRGYGPLGPSHRNRF